MRVVRFGLPVLVLFASLAGCGATPVPDVAIAHVAEATRLLEAGRVDDAEARVRLALEYHPLFAEAHADLGVIALARGHPDEAERHFRDALRIDPDLAVAESDLGLALERLGRGDEAREAWERALAIDPGLLAPRRNLVAYLVEHGAFAEARAHAYRLVQLEPGRGESQALLVYAELRLGRIEAACARLAEARGKLPDDPALARVASLVASAATESPRNSADSVTCFE